MKRKNTFCCWSSLCKCWALIRPRQSLEAMLSLELTDNVAWQLLGKLADDMNMPDIADRFRHAFQQEDVHLTTIKTWYEDSVCAQDQ